MISQTLPNLRLIGLLSKNIGRDWAQISTEIDLVISQMGYVLSEEDIYLIFSNKPLDIIEGRGECLVARSVVGPKKLIEAPFTMKDWDAYEVMTETLKSRNFLELLMEAGQILANSTLNYGPRKSEGFILRVKRYLSEELELSIELLW